MAALSLTFDDGLDSHLQIAIPELDRRNLRGTFYLNPRGADDPDSPSGWRRALTRWLPSSQTGHEMGNHTLTHPCSLNSKLEWTPQHLSRMTLDEIALNLDEAQHRLQMAFPHQALISFAYPCYESDIGYGAQRTSYVPLVARRFVAGRARGELPNQPGWCDLHHLSSWNVERMSAGQMIALVEETLARQGWGIFTFHGIDEGHLPVTVKNFTALLDHLARLREQLWIAPVAEVAASLAGSGSS
jgi:hypothetical protein